MCWISWFVSNKIDKDIVIKKMTDKISHRWPDDFGYFISDYIYLWHRRLSIIDISLWKQPITIDWYTIVFNGEIYNYKEIRKQLEEKYIFKTNSDTEVLLIWYIEYWKKILEKINWMFSFAIYSQKENNIFFARDRLWIKPFFYTNFKEEFIFSSEIKSIFEFPWVKKEINKKVINSYFQYRYILWEETFFSWIKKLEPGFYWIFDLETKNLDINKYWDLEICELKEDLWEKYYLEEVEKLLLKSIDYRMISDVNVWAYLSWGLDSSLVSAIMQKKSKKPINTFSIWFEETWFNEFEYSRKVSSYINSKHKEITLSWVDYISEMQHLISLKDAPLSVPNEIALYIMSKELKKDVTVVLSWEWADELFWWYWRIFKLYLECEQEKDILDKFLESYNYTSDESLKNILEKSLYDEIQKKSYTKNIFKNYFEKISKIDLKDKIPYIFQKLHLPWLLERVDTTTMAVWVEARVPFVDYKLVEFVNKIPYHYKIKWKDWYDDELIKEKWLDSKDISENYDTPKYILKKIAEKYLPKDIIYRKKVWFPVPLDKWIKSDFKEYAKEILLDKKTLNRWIYDKNYLKSLDWLDNLSWITIWMMINLELFFRIYFD